MCEGDSKVRSRTSAEVVLCKVQKLLHGWQRIVYSIAVRQNLRCTCECLSRLDGARELV